MSPHQTPFKIQPYSELTHTFEFRHTPKNNVGDGYTPHAKNGFNVATDNFNTPPTSHYSQQSWPMLRGHCCNPKVGLRLA